METRVLLNKQISFSHFGHEHPLKPTNSPPRENSLCSACKLKISPGNNNINKDYYTCKTCPFYLHNVCHNMPKRTQHPSHPNHHLTLQISPPKSPSSLDHEPLKCEACEGHIDGAYYYSCGECDHRLCYHVLCSALPLSVSVSCHTHELKLTFSPPYNFSCDICGRPSGAAKGWLYRCQICEFDTHLTCAIARRKAQPFPEALVNGQTTHSSSKSSLRIRRISVDYHSEVDEVMQLVTERFLCHNDESLKRDFIRLKSPKENVHDCGASRTTIGQMEAKNIGVISPSLGQPFPHQGPLTPVSEETSMVASFQLSDACFSIDLARSYSGYDAKNQGRAEAKDGDHHNQTSSGPKVEGSKIDSHEKTAHDEMTKLNSQLSDLKPQKKLSAYGNFGLGSHNYSFNVGRDERLLKEAFLVRNDTLTREELGQKGKKGKVSENKGKTTTKSHTVSSLILDLDIIVWCNFYLCSFFFFLLP